MPYCSIHDHDSMATMRDLSEVLNHNVFVYTRMTIASPMPLAGQSESPTQIAAASRTRPCASPSPYDRGS
ncbi:hypothetical protein QWZ16_04190 [Vibrio ostreicida]|uniref:Uncharacterized protein n=1 Tax=Vibrio ostreicida TaxID=526588 RepID=A0ABT8BS55_9VIBR|nr:hypothetical protein [Vibrio ostreicida]MDN3608933.1 hypothetical protein [Vibrio ostreicida]